MNAPAHPGAPPRRLRRVLTRRIGGRTADCVLRASAVGAVILLMLGLVVPSVGPLVLFVALTLWTNGPYSPVLPTAYEPMLMLFGRLYPPLLIGTLATLGTVYIEYLNYHLYVAGADRLPERVRAHPMVARLERWYARAPFATVAVAALTPLPYWAVRVLSALTHYPVGRHLAATAIGRFPRLWFIAAIATPLGIPVRWLAVVSVAIVLVLALAALRQILRRRAMFSDRTHPHPVLPQPSETPCCS